jgi:hypothetical protein
LYKKGDRQQIGNFRPVACLSKFYQLISYCINARLRDVAAVLTACDQTGFCAGRLMNWNVWTLESAGCTPLLVELRSRHYAREQNIDIAVIAWDFRKAY